MEKSNNKRIVKKVERPHDIIFEIESHIECDPFTTFSTLNLEKDGINLELVIDKALYNARLTKDFCESIKRRVKIAAVEEYYKHANKDSTAQEIESYKKLAVKECFVMLHQLINRLQVAVRAEKLLYPHLCLVQAVKRTIR